MTNMSCPTVRVGKAHPASDLIEATCSECGDLTEWHTDDDTSRIVVIRVAAQHSIDKHDNLVDAVGWVR